MDVRLFICCICVATMETNQTLFQLVLILTTPCKSPLYWQIYHFCLYPITSFSAHPFFLYLFKCYNFQSIIQRPSILLNKRYSLGYQNCLTTTLYIPGKKVGCPQLCGIFQNFHHHKTGGAPPCAHARALFAWTLSILLIWFSHLQLSSFCLCNNAASNSWFIDKWIWLVDFKRTPRCIAVLEALVWAPHPPDVRLP